MSALLPGTTLKLQQIIRRFPVPAMAALITTLLLVYLIDGVAGSFYRWPLTGFVGFLALLNWDLFSERRAFSRPAYITGLLLVGGLLAVYYSLAPGNPSTDTGCFWYITAGMVISLHLGTTIVPFTLSSWPDKGIPFSIRMMLVWLQSVLFSSVLLSALSLALVAVSVLFGWTPSEDVYLKMLIFVTGIFQTGYFLAELPDTHDETTGPAPRSIFRFLIHYAAIPIVILYGLIIHVYLMTLALSPKEMIDWFQTMNLWFLGLGTLTWLLTHFYIRQHDSRLMELFRQWFLPLSSVPMTMQWWSLYMQMQRTGMTEEAYINGIFTLVFTGIWLLCIRGGNKAVRWVPIWILTATALTFFTGPLSLCQYPVTAQQTQIKKMLERKGIIKNGVLLSPEGSLPDTNALITSSLEYLERRNSLAFLRAYDKNGLLDSMPDTLRALDLITFLHIDTYNDFVDTHYWDYNIRERDTLHIKGYDRIIPGFFANTKESARDDREYVFCSADGLAYYMTGSDTIARIDIRPMLRHMAIHPVIPHDTIVTLARSHLRIVPQFATGRLDGNSLQMTGFTAMVLVDSLEE